MKLSARPVIVIFLRFMLTDNKINVVFNSDLLLIKNNAF